MLCHQTPGWVVFHIVDEAGFDLPLLNLHTNERIQVEIKTRQKLYTTRHTIMFNTVDSLILDLLEWIGPNARPYTEVIEAWRTSCPRLPVWEEATERGFIVSHVAPGRETVAVTALGAAHLRTHRHVGVAA